MQYQDLASLFARASAEGRHTPMWYETSPGSGSDILPQGTWGTDNNSVTIDGMMITQNPDGSFSMAPEMGFQDRDNFDVITAYQDGTFTTRNEQQRSTWDKVKPAALAFMAAFGGGYLISQYLGNWLSAGLGDAGVSASTIGEVATTAGVEVSPIAMPGAITSTPLDLAVSSPISMPGAISSAPLAAAPAAASDVFSGPGVDMGSDPISTGIPQDVPYQEPVFSGPGIDMGDNSGSTGMPPSTPNEPFSGPGVDMGDNSGSTGIPSGGSPSGTSGGVPGASGAGRTLLERLLSGELTPDTIGRLLSGIAGSVNQRNFGQDLLQRASDATPNRSYYEGLLRQSYENPASYLSGPDATSSMNIVHNKLQRSDAAKGMLANDYGRQVGLNDHMIQNLGKYRSDLAQIVGTNQRTYSGQNELAAAGMQADNNWMNGVLSSLFQRG